MSDRVFSRRPLTASKRDQELFVEPPDLPLIRQAVQLGVNVFLSGPAGAGKTTLMRRLDFERDDTVHVSAEWFESTSELICGIAEALGGEPPRDRLQGTERDILEIAEALEVRPTELGPVNVVLVDGVDDAQLKTVFGRYRDALWELPLTWVVSSRGAAPEPPADAFFDRVVELTPWSIEQVGSLVQKRAADLASKQLDQLLEILGPTSPRQAIMALQAFQLSTDPDELIEVIDLERHLVSQLPDRLRDLYEALTHFGPTHASDEQLLEELGVSRSRVTHGLKELEELRLVQPERSGRRVRYRTLMSVILKLMNEEFSNIEVRELRTAMERTLELSQGDGDT